MSKRAWVIWGVMMSLIISVILFTHNQTLPETPLVVKEEIKNVNESNNKVFKDIPDNVTVVADQDLSHKNKKDDNDTPILVHLTAIDVYLRAANFEYKYVASLLIDYKADKISKDNYLKSISETRSRIYGYEEKIKEETERLTKDIVKDTQLSNELKSLDAKVSEVFDYYLTGLDNLGKLNTYEADRMIYWAGVRTNEASRIAQQILSIMGIS